MAHLKRGSSGPRPKLTIKNRKLYINGKQWNGRQPKIKKFNGSFRVHRVSSIRMMRNGK